MNPNILKTVRRKAKTAKTNEPNIMALNAKLEGFPLMGQVEGETLGLKISGNMLEITGFELLSKSGGEMYTPRIPLNDLRILVAMWLLASQEASEIEKHRMAFETLVAEHNAKWDDGSHDWLTRPETLTDAAIQAEAAKVKEQRKRRK